MLQEQWGRQTSFDHILFYACVCYKALLLTFFMNQGPEKWIQPFLYFVLWESRKCAQQIFNWVSSSGVCWFCSLLSNTAGIFGWCFQSCLRDFDDQFLLKLMRIEHTNPIGNLTLYVIKAINFGEEWHVK